MKLTVNTTLFVWHLELGCY